MPKAKMLVRLVRTAYLPHCTIGHLKMPDGQTFPTIEPPWRQNVRNRSCIPEGVYSVGPHNGRKYKDVWRLHDVPDRSDILIHAGNRVKDTQGCILPGQQLDTDEYKVLNSRAAINELRELLPERFDLQITQYRPEYP